MRQGVARFSAVLLVVALAACGGSAPAQEFGKADVDQIRKMVQDFTAAYNAKDVAKIATFFSASASVMAPNRSTLRGVDAVKLYYEERLNREGASGLEIEPQAVEGHGTLAYVVGNFSLNLQPADSTPRRDRGRVIWIARKLGGEWRFEWQMMASDLPPVAPATPPAQ